MPKEKNYNPVAAHAKAEKQRVLKRSKAQVQAQRDEKLARRNPERLQRQVDELKASAERGELRPHDREQLNRLEKEVALIRKARERLGDAAPKFRPERRDGEGDGRETRSLKRKRWEDERWSDEETTDTEARKIPMPGDSPPPVSRKVKEKLDRRRHAARQATEGEKRQQQQAEVPKIESKAEYSSAPQVRNLRKEAINAFTPSIVRQKIAAQKGEGGRLLEPEEMDKLEAQGYTAAKGAAAEAAKEAEYRIMASEAAEQPEDAVEQTLRDVEAEISNNIKSDAGSSLPSKDGLMRDAERAVDAAIQEAQHEMIVEQSKEPIQKPKALISYGDSDSDDDTGEQERIAQKAFRHVEIEEVEDDGT